MSKVHTYALYCHPGREKSVCKKVEKLKRHCRKILAAASLPFEGYVKITVAVDAEEKTLDLPKDVKNVLNIISGIKVVGNGNEAVPL